MKRNQLDLPPPKLSAEWEAWERTIVNKLRTLQARVAAEFWPFWYLQEKSGNEAFSAEDWRTLAIFLAIKHKENGFVLPPAATSRRAADHEYIRDDLMHKHVYGQIVKDEDRTHLEIDESRRQMSDSAAAAKVHKLLTEWERRGDYAGKVPTAAAIRSQWSKRINEAKRSGAHILDRIPTYLKTFSERNRLFDGIRGVAGAMSGPPDKDEVV